MTAYRLFLECKLQCRRAGPGGDRLAEVEDASGVDDGLVREVTEILTLLCARWRGLAIADHARCAVAVAGGAG